MKRILISGGAGFIGSYLYTQLVNEGHDVICLGNFFTGSKDNTRHLMGNHHFEVARRDVTYPYFTKMDEIYNLAYPALPIHYQRDPIQTTKTSVMGAINMLGLAIRLDAKILQAPASEVYGDPTIHPQPGNYWGNVNPAGYRSCYDEGKRYAKTSFMDYYRQNQTRIKITRVFNTYSPRMFPNDDHVVSSFIMQVLNSENIMIYGGGKQTRSFQYIDDLIEGMMRMMDTEDNFADPINIGSPDEFPVFELAEGMIRMTGSTSKIVFKPLSTDDPKQRRLDIKLAKERLGWQPTVKLKDGLKRVIGYLKNA